MQRTTRPCFGRNRMPAWVFAIPITWMASVPRAVLGAHRFCVLRKRGIPAGMLVLCAAAIAPAAPADLTVAPEAFQAREWQPKGIVFLDEWDRLEASQARMWNTPAQTPSLDSDWQAKCQYLSITNSLFRGESASDLVKQSLRFGQYYTGRWRLNVPASHPGLYRIFGLVFDLTVTPSGWPELAVPCAIGIGRHPLIGDWDSHHHDTNFSRRYSAIEERRIALGAVRVPDAGCDLESENPDWTHNTLSFTASDADAGIEDSLSITVSRLTPAVLIETTSAALDLFVGKFQPRNVAFASANGIRLFALKPGSGAGAALEDIGKQFGGDGGGQSPIAKALAEMQDDWMLLWYGKDSRFSYHPYPLSYSRQGYAPNPYAPDFVPADCPVLAVFGGPVQDVSSGNDCVRFKFDPAQDMQSVVLLPIFGLNHPERAVTEKWANGLPAEVAERCAWWAEHFARFPLTVREEYALDPEHSTASVTERFEFKTLRESGSFLAPVPPMLALAKRQGLAIDFSGPVEDHDCVTGIGPAAGIPNVESYTWSLPKLPQYVLERPAAGAKPAPSALQKLLEDEVRKILDAGHLAPWLAILHDLPLDGGYYFLRSDETLRYLGAVLDLLPQDLAEQTRQYMKAERAAYPPETCLFLPLFKGARREYWPADERAFRLYNPEVAFKEFPAFVGYLPDPVWLPDVPVRVLYGLWAGVDAEGGEVDDATWANAQALLMSVVPAHEWASLGWFTGGAELAGVDGQHIHRHHEEPYYGGVMAANSYFAGLVGFIRLARLRGDKPSEAFGWGMLSRAAALRFAMGKFTGFLYEAGALRIPPQAQTQPDWMTRNKFEGGYLGGYLWAMNWTKPEHDVRQALILDERGIHLLEQQQQYRHVYLPPFIHITPELGRFLGDNLRPECGAFFDRVRENMPDWHMAYREAKLGGDKQHFRFPSDAHQLFMERAWIAREPPERLAGWLDVPWLERGDLFFLEKLAATIRAYRGVEWQRL